MKSTGAQFEISVGRVPRTYRDRLDYATEAAEFLKRLNPNTEVAVTDLQSNQRTVVALPVSAVPKAAVTAGPMARLWSK
jgi:hypothetical protein